MRIWFGATDLKWLLNDMPNNREDPQAEPAEWEPIWRRKIDPPDPDLIRRLPEHLGTLQSIFKLRSIQDICKLVRFPYRLPRNRGHELFDPAAAIERLERFRSNPTPELATVAREAIIQFVRALPAERSIVRAWETDFSNRDMSEFLSDAHHTTQRKLQS